MCDLLIVIKLWFPKPIATASAGNTSLHGALENSRDIEVALMGSAASSFLPFKREILLGRLCCVHDFFQQFSIAYGV